MQKKTFTEIKRTKKNKKKYKKKIEKIKMKIYIDKEKEYVILFKNKLDKISAQVYGNTGMDFATFSLNCIKGDLETAWPLYTDAMLSPRFDAKEFARIKQDAINVIRANESDPDNAVNKMARQTA